MKTVEFKKSTYYVSDEVYICLCKGEDNPCGIDHSGTYVLASEAAERERVLVEALESMIVVCKEPQSYDFVKVIEIIRAALVAKEG